MDKILHQISGKNDICARFHTRSPCTFCLKVNFTPT